MCTHALHIHPRGLRVLILVAHVYVHCVDVHVCACVGEHVCTCMHMHVDVRGWSRFLQEPPTLSYLDIDGSLAWSSPSGLV